MIKIGLTDFTPASKIIDIRDKEQDIIARKAIGVSDVLKSGLMGEHYIELSFELNINVLFKRSNYIEWEGERYTLRDDYRPEQVSKKSYKYTLKFEAVEMLFQDIQYYYLNQGVKEAEWRLIGNPEYFMRIAVDNINRYFGGTDFSVGTVEPVETKDIVFDTDTNTFDALTQIAEEYEAEWYITGKTIHLLNKVSFGGEVDFETDVSVLAMKRSKGEESARYTRIVALGSTRNIPKDYRETSSGEGVDAIYPKRLRIPVEKGDAIDAYPDMLPVEAVEGTVIFDDIYPKRVGTVEAVGTVEYAETDEETGISTPWNAYKLKDSGIDFKEEYVLPGEELRLVFESGKLNGMDFALIFRDKGFSDTDDSQYFEIVRSDDYGKPLPNEAMKPEAGDKYALYGFDIALVSDQYVPTAEQELYDTASEWLRDRLKDTDVYECPTAIGYFKANQMDLAIGQKVRLIKDMGSSRNLMIGSDFTRSDSDASNWAITSYWSYSFENGMACYTALSNVNASRLERSVYLTAGRYTISLYANAKYGFDYHNWVNATPIPTERSEVDGFYNHKVTFDVPVDATVRMLFYTRNRYPVGDKIYIKRVKLEEGGKATDWTPAPEDAPDGIRSSRITGFEKKLNNKFDASYTVGDNAAYSRLAGIEKEIDELRHAGIVYANYGGNGAYVIKQFDNTKPSDFNVYSAQASNAKYFNKRTGDTVEGDTLFKRNVQTLGLNIADVFQNGTFTAGQLGSGFQMKRDANGQSYLEVDNLLVRRETVFNRLTIAEIKSVGGTILLSLASMVISKVEDAITTWKCFFDTANGTIPNDFEVGDQAVCRKYTGQNMKYYWALVTAVGAGYIALSKTDKDGFDFPDIGDELIQLGNRTDVNRRYAITLSAYGSDAPSIKQYAGIASYDLTNKEVTAITPKGNKFTGSFAVSTNGTTAPVYKDRGVFVNGTAYYMDDRVSYLGSYWVCVVNVTITAPSEGSAAWRKETAGQTDIDAAADQVREEYQADFLVLDTKIAAKVSRADFDALGNRVSEAESTLTVQAGQIESKVSKDGVISSINQSAEAIRVQANKLMIDGTTVFASGYDPTSIQVGGVNLLVKSDFTRSDSDASNWAITSYWSYSFEDSMACYTALSNVNAARLERNVHLQAGEYTMSLYANARYGFDYINWLNATPETTDRSEVNGFYVHKVTFTVPVEADVTMRFYTRDRYATGSKIYIKRVKLEKGNKPTDWTPAPEDVEAEITAARQAANAAQASANSANALLADIADDNKLTPEEKQATKLEWNKIAAEYPKITADAAYYSIGYALYTNAYNSLSAYITPLLANLTATSDITGTTFRTTFISYYNARQDLLNLISQRAKDIGDKKGNNLLYPELLKISEGGALSPEDWNKFAGTLNGGTDQNLIVSSENPFGEQAKMWKCESVNGDGVSPNGGFTSLAFAVDLEETYRFAVFVKKKSDIRSYIYLGTKSALVETLDGVPDNNPYFVNTNGSTFQLISADKWYLMVGYIFPSGYVDENHVTLSGLYDVTTGKVITQIPRKDFRFRNEVSSRTATMRAFQFNGVQAGIEVLFYAPMAHKCDGTEPSLATILGIDPYAQGIAQAARQAAQQAESDARQATDRLDDWASDDYISPTEKTGLLQQLADMQAEYAEILNRASLYLLITSSQWLAYNSAYTAARNAINKYTADIPESIPVDADYGDIATYYEKRQDILNLIAVALNQEIANLDYLKEALIQDTTVTGGLISTAVIRLGSNEAGDSWVDRAGLNGLIGSGETEVRLWCGESYANRANAPFRVLQNGGLYAGNADVSGNIVAESGSIGGFIISQGELKSPEQYGFSLTSDSLFYTGANGSYLAAIGHNVVSSVSGSRVVARFENKVTNLATNIAMLVSAANASNNIAIRAEGSVISTGIAASRAYFQLTLTAQTNTIALVSGNVCCIYVNNDSYRTAYLPSLSAVFTALNLTSGTPFMLPIKVVAFHFNTASFNLYPQSGMNIYTPSGNNSSYITLSKGNSVELLLVYDGGNYWGQVTNAQN